MWQALEVQLNFGTPTALMKHLARSYRRFEAVEYPEARYCSVSRRAVSRWHRWIGYALAAIHAIEYNPCVFRIGKGT